MPKNKKPGRRKFIIRTVAASTGVLAVGTYLFHNSIRRKIAALANTIEIPYLGNTDTPLIWFETTGDDKVIFYSPKIEMGQGALTGLAQLAVEELGIHWDQLLVKHAPTDLGNVDEFATGGSTSITALWIPLRELAATMRQMIRSAAADKWQVPLGEVVINNGRLIHKDKSMTFSQACNGVEDWRIPRTVELKAPADFRFIGKPLPRVDLNEKVFGAPIFGFDKHREEMRYASILKPAIIGAQRGSYDLSEAEAMPGVEKVIVKDDFIAVVAREPTIAEMAKSRIKVNWEYEKLWSHEAVMELLEIGRGRRFHIEKEGRAEPQLAASEGVSESEYSSPFGAHAQLEPNAALAYMENGKMVVEVATQVVHLTREEVARRVNMASDDVIIIPAYLGGGFGRRLHTPHAAIAALLCKEVQAPVKLALDREQEFQLDDVRTATRHRLRASLDATGLIRALVHEVSSGDVALNWPALPALADPLLGADPGAWRGGMIQYRGIEHYSLVSWRVKLPFLTGQWRGLGLLANTFAVESFMDELAVAAEQDPVTFRLRHIPEDARGKRLKAVLQEVARIAEYPSGDKGVHHGIAVSTDVNTPCAQIAEVSVADGVIHVHKVFCAIDPGIVINPDQVKAQCEGAICMGLSAALYEEMVIEDGKLYPSIYGPYRMAKLAESPREIAVSLIESGNKPTGVGEPPIGPIGAAIANAVFRATGKRLRKMPLQQAMNTS